MMARRPRRLDTIPTEYHGIASPDAADLDGERNKANVSVARHRSLRQMLLAEIGNVEDMLGARKRREDDDAVLEAVEETGGSVRRRLSRAGSGTGTTEGTARKWRSSEGTSNFRNTQVSLPQRAQYVSIVDTIASSKSVLDEEPSESMKELLKMLRDAKAAVHSIPLKDCRPKNDALQLLTTAIESVKTVRLSQETSKVEEDVEPPKGIVTIVSLVVQNVGVLWRAGGSKETLKADLREWAKAARAAVRRHGGWEISCSEDEMRVAFQSPVKAALWAVACTSHSITPTLPKSLSYSAGIDRGTPIMESDPLTGRQHYYGPLVSSASTLSSKAAAHEILTTKSVLRSLGDLAALGLAVNELSIRLHNQPLYSISRRGVDSGCVRTGNQSDDVKHIIHPLAVGRNKRCKAKGLVEWIEENRDDTARMEKSMQSAMDQCKLVTVKEEVGPYVVTSIITGVAPLWYENVPVVGKAVETHLLTCVAMSSRYKSSINFASISSVTMSYPDLATALEGCKYLRHVMTEIGFALHLFVDDTVNSVADRERDLMRVVKNRFFDGVMLRTSLISGCELLFSKLDWMIGKSKLEGLVLATPNTGWKPLDKRSSDGTHNPTIGDYWTTLFPVLERKRNEIKAAEQVLLHCKAGSINSNPPQGAVVLGYIDVQTETVGKSMTRCAREALSLFTHKVRSLLVQYDGYEVIAEADAFKVAFKEPQAALQLASTLQTALMTLQWPESILESEGGEVVHAENSNTILWKGLRVRVALHKGTPTCAKDPITGRMDYYGGDVSVLEKVASMARGGEIMVTGPFATGLEGMLDNGFIVTHQPSMALPNRPHLPVLTLTPMALKERVFEEANSHHKKRDIARWWDKEESKTHNPEHDMSDITSNIAVIIRTIHNYAIEANSERSKSKDPSPFNERIVSLARSVAGSIRSVTTKHTELFDLDIRYTAFLDEILAIPDIQEEDKDKKYMRQNTLTKFKVAALSVKSKGDASTENIKSELFGLHKLLQNFFILIKKYMATIDPFVSRDVLSESEFIDLWVTYQAQIRNEPEPDEDGINQQFVLQSDMALEDPSLQPSTWNTVSKHSTALCNKHFLLLKQSLKRVQLQKQNLQRRVSCAPPPMSPLTPPDNYPPSTRFAPEFLSPE